MAQVRLVRRSNPIRVNPSKALADVGRAIVEATRSRLRAGVGGDGAPLPAYSALYRQQLAAIGAAMVVDINSSGALLADLKVLRVSRSGDVWSVVVGVGTGTSTRTPRPPPWVFAGTPAQNAKALERWRASAKKATQTEQHQVVLDRLQQAGPGRPARKVLGLPPAKEKEIARMLSKLPIFRYG